MTDYELTDATHPLDVPLNLLISGLYINELDNGFLSQSLRNDTVRRATIESSNAYLELISIVDVVALAGYSAATSNWRNIINCYYKPPFNVHQWSTLRAQAQRKYIAPKISTSSNLHGKMAVVPFKVAVGVLTRLPATKERAIADIHRIYAEHAAIVKRFELTPPLDAALGCD